MPWACSELLVSAPSGSAVKATARVLPNTRGPGLGGAGLGGAGGLGGSGLGGDGEGGASEVGAGEGGEAKTGASVSMTKESAAGMGAHLHAFNRSVDVRTV